jgi:NADPH:quinone reductase-like Zn-dependent oxidoreductase
MPAPVPSEMNALVASEIGTSTADALAKLAVKRVPVPTPKRGQVLVRMHATPCNPADLYYLEGRYGIDRPLPAIPGFEGSGEVVASGGGLLGRWLVGKRVACGGHEGTGTWAEYCVVASNQCLPLRKDIDFEKGATAVANPMTALALVSLIAKHKHRAYLQTAAAGQLGKMLYQMAADRGFDGIQIVRRAEQAEAMRVLGAKHVLISSDADFDTQLARTARDLDATIAFDAVAGPITGQLVNALPENGEVLIYGALAAQPSGGIDPMRIAFGNRRIRGFEIAGHLKDIGLLRAIRLGNTAQRWVASGRASTTVRDRVTLADAPTRLAGYATAMSEGKVLILPSPSSPS